VAAGGSTLIKKGDGEMTDGRHILRILKAYRKRCNVKYEADSLIPVDAANAINDMCDKRVAFLDKEIAVREKVEEKVDP